MIRETKQILYFMKHRRQQNWSDFKNMWKIWDSLVIAENQIMTEQVGQTVKNYQGFKVESEPGGRTGLLPGEWKAREILAGCQSPKTNSTDWNVLTRNLYARLIRHKNNRDWRLIMTTVILISFLYDHNKTSCIFIHVSSKHIFTLNNHTL